MPRRQKREKMNEKNDTIVIAKADGGVAEDDKVFQEFGELHSEEFGATINIQHKIPVLEPTVLGRPPVQKKMIYYIDEEPQDCGFDPEFMFGKLPSAYNLSANGNGHENEEERKHKRNMDVLFVIAGAFFLVFAILIAPMIGWTLKSGDGDDTPVPPKIEPRAAAVVEYTDWIWERET